MNPLISVSMPKYHKAGMSVLPALAKKKRPAIGTWKAYQSQRPTEQEIASWLKQDPEAICIITGRASGNVEVIDFDAGGKLFQAWFDSIPQDLRDLLVIERTPSGGYHVIYRCEGAIEGNQKLAVIDGETCIETRGEGGLVLCDPSPGYMMEQGNIAELLIITADERDTLLAAARRLNQDTQTPSIATTARLSGDNEHWRRPGKEQGTSATLKECDGVLVFYVFTSNAPLLKPSKSYTPFQLYAALEHDGSFSAAASKLRSEGYGEQVAGVGMDLTGIWSQPVECETGVIAVCESIEPATIRKIGADYPQLRPPVLDGVLRRGETANVIAAPKVGKSWLMYDLALAVAAGRRWLDAFDTAPGRVLLIDNELHPETIVHRIPKVAEACGIEEDDYADDLDVLPLRGRGVSLPRLQPFINRFGAGQYRLIVCDAWYRFIPEGLNENSNADVMALYNLLDRYANQSDAAWVVVHHSSKGQQGEKAITDVGAGAGAQSRAADTHIILRPHEEDGAVVLEAATRSFAPLAPVGLRWSFPTWTRSHTLNTDAVKGRKTVGEERQKRRDDEGQADILQALKDGPLSVRQVRGHCGGMGKDRAERLLDMLEAEGVVKWKHGEINGGKGRIYERI